MRVKEKFNKKLLVEGNDDQHVIWTLCEKFKVEENFDVIDTEGIEKLFAQIPIRLKQSGIDTIGIVIDADSNLTGRWNSLSGIFTNLGYTLPVQIPVDGLVIQLSGIKLGVWIMPNNSLNGMLEDFISFLVPDEDQLLKFANDTLAEIETNSLNKYSSIHKSKALIHSWLSWQEDPGTPMGLAITKRYLSTEKDICKSFVEWLNETFS